MADPWDLPLHPSGAGTGFGWTGPSKKQLAEENAAREAARWAASQGWSDEEIIATFGPKLGMGDPETLRRIGREATQRKVQGLERTRPRVEDIPTPPPTGQVFDPLQPDLPEPRAFPPEGAPESRGLPDVTAPGPRSTLSDMYFPQSTYEPAWAQEREEARQPGGIYPDVSLYPKGERPTTPMLPEPQEPRALPPEASGPPRNMNPADYPGKRARNDDTGEEFISNGTAWVPAPSRPSPPPPPPPARPPFPDMTKRGEVPPEEPAVPPAEPAVPPAEPARPAVPAPLEVEPPPRAPIPPTEYGKRRVPGEDPRDIVIQDPKMLRPITEFLPKFMKLEEQVRETRRAEVKATREEEQAKREDAQIKYRVKEGQRLSISDDPEEREHGRRLLALSKGGKEALGVMEKLEDDMVKRREAKREQARVDLMRRYAAESPSPEDKQLYEAAAIDPKLADIVFKRHDAARKDALARSPAGRWKAFSDTYGNDVAGELAATPGLTPETVTDAHLRKAINNVNAEKTSRAKAGAAQMTMGDMKWSPAERREIAEQMTAMDNFTRLSKTLRTDQSLWVGGPFGIWSRLDSLFAHLGYGHDESLQARNDIGQSASLIRRAFQGTAVTNIEARFGKWIPTGREESTQELIAKLESVAENIRRGVEYQTYLAKGGDPTDRSKLPMMATPEGDKSWLDPSGGRTDPAADAKQRLKDQGIIQ